MLYMRQYHCALVLSGLFLFGCSKKKLPPPVSTENQSQVLEAPGSELRLIDSAASVPVPVVKEVDKPAAQPRLSINGTKKRKGKKRFFVKNPLPKPVLTVAAATEVLHEPPPPEEALEFPRLPEELVPFILALYQKADSLAEIAPDSSMALINTALRYCDDGAFYALAAGIASKRGNFYQCQVLAERGFIKPANLNPNAHERALRLLIHSLQTMDRESPSSNLEARLNSAVQTYQLRYQRPPEDEP